MELPWDETAEDARRHRAGAGMTRWRVACMALVAGFAIGAAAGAPAQQAVAGTAAALHAKHLELQAQLRTGSFGEPLVLIARESPNRLEGDAYAEVAHPLAAIAAALRTSAGLCQLLFLHPNVRGCTPSGAGDDTGLTLLVGPKRAGAAGLHDEMHYAMHTEWADAAHLQVTLGAARGPLSTRDYRMVFEAVPIDAGRSFVHFGYSYGYGAWARMVANAYLATAGRSKIGFTVEGREADGRPKYVRGVRAAIERNVMRYYLALLANLSVTTGSPEAQLQARLRAWFALTERHAAQLHEYELDEYLHEKQDDLARSPAGK